MLRVQVIFLDFSKILECNDSHFFLLYVFFFISSSTLELLRWLMRSSNHKLNGDFINNQKYELPIYHFNLPEIINVVMYVLIVLTRLVRVTVFELIEECRNKIRIETSLIFEKRHICESICICLKKGICICSFRFIFF